MSYYDKRIGENNLVYTKVEPVRQGQRIYQSDLCGWVGQVGYGNAEAYGANVYCAKGQEALYGAGFYATGADTDYEIYIVKNIQQIAEWRERRLVASGHVAWSGYYTISWEEPILLEEGERFGVLLYVKTPNVVHPIAIEYQADEATSHVDITDGEGYISADGIRWEALEKNYGCNLCLKAYTISIEDRTWSTSLFLRRQMKER